MQSDHNTAGTVGQMEEEKEEVNKFASNDESTDSDFDNNDFFRPFSA